MPVLFLTGIPRSGTTWAAQALAALTRARYVHEPFNAVVHTELAQYEMVHMSARSCNRDFLRILDHKLRPHYPRRKLREFILGRNIVCKDVHTGFAAECVQRHLGARIVILTRHPCATAASWKAQGWIENFSCPLNVLLRQPSLWPLVRQFESHVCSSTNAFFQFGAYWGAMYHVFRRLATGHPEWQWVNHEDLCRNPVPAFCKILETLKMPIRAKSTDFFRLHDRPPRPNEGAYETFRETRLEPERWKWILSVDEAQGVLEGAKPFSPEVLLETDVEPEQENCLLRKGAESR